MRQHTKRYKFLLHCVLSRLIMGPRCLLLLVSATCVITRKTGRHPVTARREGRQSRARCEAILPEAVAALLVTCKRRRNLQQVLVAPRPHSPLRGRRAARATSHALRWGWSLTGEGGSRGEMVVNVDDHAAAWPLCVAAQVMHSPCWAECRRRRLHAPHQTLGEAAPVRRLSLLEARVPRKRAVLEALAAHGAEAKSGLNHSQRAKAIRHQARSWGQVRGSVEALASHRTHGSRPGGSGRKIEGGTKQHRERERRVSG